MARIPKGDFGKRHCNTEMSTVIPFELKSGNTYTIALGKIAIATCSTTATLLLIALFCYSRSSFVASIRTSLVHFFPALLNNGKTRRFCPDTLSVCLVFMAYFYLKSKVLFFHKSKLMAELLLSHGRMQFINLHRDPKPES